MLQRFDGVGPRVDPTAWVHPSAIIIGDVVIGPHSSVWPTVVLRGDMGPIRIGAYTNLQDGVICHDTTDISETIVGDRVTVGHRAILHGCRIEDDVLVGMGSIVMDNAVVGQNSLVGAGALISPNKVIPPRSLVLGQPGRVRRTLTDKEVHDKSFGWRTYAEKAEQWRQQAE